MDVNAAGELKKVGRLLKRIAILPLVLISSLCLGESQIYYSDTCTFPSVGSSTASCSLSSSIGGSSSLSYTRYNLYGGVHKIVPDGVTHTGKFSSLTSSNVRYGILFDSFQVSESATNNLQWSITSTNSTCPSATTYNWLLMRARTPDLAGTNDIFNKAMDFSSSSQYVGGTMSYSSSSFTGVDYFDISLLTKVNSSSGGWSSFGFNGYNSATCSSGNYTVQGTGSNFPMDEYGYLYFGSNSFFLISAGGNPVVTVGVPQQSLTSTVMGYLSNDILTGFFTYYTGFNNQDQRTVYFVPNGSNFSGSTYEFDIYQSSTNLNGGSPTTSALTSSSQNPSGQTQLGKITCSSLDSPTEGFCSGTLDMSASGVSGTGNAVCEFYTGSTGHLIACAAQYPANKSEMVSFIGQTPSSALIASTVNNSGLVQLSSSGSGNLTATVTNLTGRAIASLGNPSDLGESSTLNLSSPFSAPTYSGSSGVCGSSLPGYGSCTLTVTYTTSGDGATLETFRSAYDSGGNGTVNATAIVSGTTGLSSIAISSPTMGTSQNLTATATFADNSTYDVSSMVNWGSSNSSVASITNDLGNSTNGYATLSASGVARISAALGNVSSFLFADSVTSATIQTFAGGKPLTPASGNTGDGLLAAGMALLYYPNGTAADSQGNVYVADTYNNRIQMIPAVSGTYFGQAMTASYMYTIAGSSNGYMGSMGNGGPATAANIDYPYGLALDSSGNLYIADTYNARIQMVPVADGFYFGQSMTAAYMYTIAGTGSSGSGGDGSAATLAALNNPYGVAVDSSGNLYIADTYNYQIQMVPAVDGTYFGQFMTATNMYTIAGVTGASGSSGDGGASTAANLYNPYGVAVDSTGNLYIADTYNSRIQMVPEADGTYFGQAMTASNMYTIAGAGYSGTGGDGGPASAAYFNYASGVAVDSSGNLYISDYNNNQIDFIPAANGSHFGRSMTASNLYTIAGSLTETPGSTGTGGVATAALLYNPGAVTPDTNGNIYIADYNNHRIEMVPTTSGTYFGQVMTANDMYTIAGSNTGSFGHTGNGGAASSALLRTPRLLSTDSLDNLYIGDANNHRIQMIPAVTGTYFGQVMTAKNIYTIAGSSTGSSGHTGNGGASTSGLLDYPYGAVVDTQGNLIIADTYNNRIQMVAAANGTYFGQAMTANDIYTIAGSSTGSSGYLGDGGAATSALLNGAFGVTVDRSGNIYISDFNNNRVQMVPTANGTYFGQAMTANYMYTVAGSSSGSGRARKIRSEQLR